MVFSLSLIFLVGLSTAAICRKIHLPRIIGMLVTGILLGPYVLNLLDSSILRISAELRQFLPLLLSIAVLSILITAPLGAIGMDLSYSHLLKQEN